MGLLCRAYHCTVIVLLSLAILLLESSPSPIFRIRGVQAEQHAETRRQATRSDPIVWGVFNSKFPANLSMVVVYASREGITSDIYDKGVTGDLR